MPIVIRTADYQVDGEVIRFVRRQVFCQEQRVPESLDFDGRDETAQHLLAEIASADTGHRAVATLRWRRLEPRGDEAGNPDIGQVVYKVERLAVLPSHRRQGIALQLMEFALAVLKQQNGKTVVVHAQSYIQPLYDRLQFVAEGDRFVEAGIEHVKMVRCI